MGNHVGSRFGPFVKRASGLPKRLPVCTKTFDDNATSVTPRSLNTRKLLSVVTERDLICPAPLQAMESIAQVQINKSRCNSTYLILLQAGVMVEWFETDYYLLFFSPTFINNYSQLH